MAEPYYAVSFAPRFRQITTPVPHHSVLAGSMPFLPPNQQRQRTVCCTQSIILIVQGGSTVTRRYFLVCFLCFWSKRMQSLSQKDTISVFPVSAASAETLAK